MAVLVAGSVLTAVLLRSPLLGGVFAVLYMLVDFLVLELVRWRQASIGSARLTITSLAQQNAAIIGGRFHLGVDLHPLRSVFDCLIVPVVPAGVSMLQPGGYCGSLRSNSSLHLDFEFSLDHAGSYVIPGVIVSTRSLLGLFSKSQLLGDRQGFVVAPDYLSGSQLSSALLQRRSLTSDTARRHVTRGAGSDFRELREHQPADSVRRVDWKATARRGRLMVREYEEPREFTIRIIFDASIDMCFGARESGGFANAASLVARLASLARDENISLHLSLYDEWGVHRQTMGRGGIGMHRFIRRLVEMPRQALLTSLHHQAQQPVEATVRRAWKRSRHLWPGRRLDDVLADEFPDHATPRGRMDQFLSEFAPDLVANMPQRCPQCGAIVQPDECACRRCQRRSCDGSLPPRAARAVEALAMGLRQSKGREMLVFISAFAGGEPCEEVASHLALAAAGHRSVHVACPQPVTMRGSRYILPESLGNFSTPLEALRNLYRLHHAARHQVFYRRLAAQGIHVHHIEQREDLDRIITTILLHEVLAASA